MTGRLADLRLVAADLAAAELADDEEQSQLAEASARLGSFATCEVGLWEAGPGAGTDTEADELFIILSGRGSITFEDGSQLDLTPGTVVRLRKGDRTTWTISERIRKLFLTCSA